MRFRLSVKASTITATPLGPYPSYVIFSYLVSSPSPAAFLIIRSILSFGTLAAFALAIQSFNLELELGSGPPPSLTATESSRPIFVKTLALAPSVFSFFLLILFHFEWPDINLSSQIILLHFIISQLRLYSKVLGKRTLTKQCNCGVIYAYLLNKHSVITVSAFQHITAFFK